MKIAKKVSDHAIAVTKGHERDIMEMLNKCFVHHVTMCFYQDESNWIIWVQLSTVSVELDEMVNFLNAKY